MRNILKEPDRDIGFFSLLNLFGLEREETLWEKNGNTSKSTKHKEEGKMSGDGEAPGGDETTENMRIQRKRQCISII